MGENPLKGYYLTRVYKDDDPFTTVMDLFRADAVAMCEKLAPNRHVDTPGQAAYLEEREEVENWVRESAKAVGVDIKEKNPIYFALTTEPEKSTPGRHVISIPADQIDLSRCSFTFDDSFNNYSFVETHGEKSGVDPHPMHGVVLNADQAAKAIKKYGVLGHYDDKRRYIEVQMWDRPVTDMLPQQSKPQQSRFQPNAQTS